MDDLLNAGGALRALADQAQSLSWPDDPGEEEDMRRRALLAGAGGAVLGGALSALDPVRRDTEAALGGPVAEHDAVEWERAADEYALLVNQLPAQRLLPELLVDLDDARQHLDRAPERLKPRLARVCALFGGIAALSLVGAGYWREAGRYWRLAERAARLSGDRTLSCVIGGRRSVFSLYAPGSTPDTALALSSDALAWSDGQPNAGTASALATRAQVLAMQGDRAGARNSLNDLEAVFDRLDDDVTRGPGHREWSWPETRLRHVQSFVHSHLGAREAADAQDAALALYTYPSSLGAAQVRCHQAMSMIVSGDPTTGVRHVVDVLESLDPSFRRGFVKTSAVRALRALPERAAGLPEVRQARELLGASA
ncbi:hypothetical protein BKA01_007000 [Pseudonocardia eucalypti]|nr:hypothetical protein [Pseudonocardia eucalypti]